MASGSIAGGSQGHRLTTLDNGARSSRTGWRGGERLIGAWFGVGTRNESPEANGVAHLLEHMAFKGTKRRSPAAIAEEIEAVGGISMPIPRGNRRLTTQGSLGGMRSWRST